MHPPPPALGVLTGGRSTRFPGGKLRASLGEASLLTTLLAGIEEVAPRRFLLGSPPHALEVPAGWELLEDRTRDRGPLAGLARLAEECPDGFLVVAGDQPRLPPTLLRALWREAVGAPTACFELPGASCPLPMAVTPAAYQALRALLEGPEPAGPSRLLRETGGRRVGPEAVGLDPAALAAALVDVDTPEDLARLGPPP